MKGQYFIPQVGHIYRNRNGQQYLCLKVELKMPRSDTVVLFRRISDGWTLQAHGPIRYGDNTIEWNYSTGGHWSK